MEVIVGDGVIEIDVMEIASGIGQLPLPNGRGLRMAKRYKTVD